MGAREVDLRATGRSRRTRSWPWASAKDVRLVTLNKEGAGRTRRLQCPDIPGWVPVRAHRPLAGSSITSATVVVEAGGKTFISTCANVTSASQPNL